MPIARNPPSRHRQKSDTPWPVFSALVAKTISPAEMRKIPKTMEAMKAEADKLAKNGVWDLESVMNTIYANRAQAGITSA